MQAKYEIEKLERLFNEQTSLQTIVQKVKAETSRFQYGIFFLGQVRQNTQRFSPRFWSK